MGRIIVLCLIFLSAFFSPGSACAITITGEIWSTNALTNAITPSLGPPADRISSPDAKFTIDAIDISAINFDSRRISDIQDREKITYNQFLNNSVLWNDTITSREFPNSRMFSSGSNEQGIFFRFSWTMDYDGGSFPITITHDDGIYFTLLGGYPFDSSTPVTGNNPPRVSKFNLNDHAIDPGSYLWILEYGALNDSTTHVLIWNTPEPGTILLLGFGLVAIGAVILMRRWS